MAGQTVTGSVSYVLEKPYPAEKLTLELLGREMLVWDGYDDKNLSAKYPGKICMKSTTIKLQQVLVSFPNGEAKVGKQTIPFTIQLPNELPPSFLYVGKNGA